MHHFSLNKLHCLTNTLMSFGASWCHSLGVLPSSLNMVSKNLTPTEMHYTKASGPLLKANLNSSFAYHYTEPSVMYEAIYKNFTTSNISYACTTSVSVTNQCNHIQYYTLDTPLSKCKPMVTEYTSTISYIFKWKCPKHSLLGEKQGDIQHSIIIKSTWCQNPLPQVYALSPSITQ
jgi:hypothetical protein